jgi:hypothetical protein
MVPVSDFIDLLHVIAANDRADVVARLDATPALATARLPRTDEFLLTERLVQLYEGDTALHAAAFSYDVDIARELLARGADIHAVNRRKAEPLHAATAGGPRAPGRDPKRQSDVIRFLIAAGADPNVTAADAVTPLHRAVRNRCAAAVETLLEAGADPRQPNKKGSTAFDLAQWTTGRGGTGTPEAKAEQQIIQELLARY